MINLPEDLLVIALFENSVLHAQNFAQRLENYKALSFETQTELVNHIMEYALAIMVFYFHASDRLELKNKVMKKYEEFILNENKMEDADVQKRYLEWSKNEIGRKVQWLSLGTNITNLENNHFVEQIISDAGFKVDIPKYTLEPHIKHFVNDVIISMKHFGIMKNSSTK